MECAIAEYTMCYSYCNWHGQEDFAWQETWRTSSGLLTKMCYWIVENEVKENMKNF